MQVVGMAVFHYFSTQFRVTSLSRSLKVNGFRSSAATFSLVMPDLERVLKTSDKSLKKSTNNVNYTDAFKWNGSRNRSIAYYASVRNSRPQNSVICSEWKSRNAFEKDLQYNLTGFANIKHIRSSSTCFNVVDKKLGDLRIFVEDGLRIISFDRPKKKNAITQEMYRDLPLALKEAADDDGTIITVLTGSGDYYTSGNDLTAFAKFQSSDINEAAYEGSVLLRDFVSAFIEFPKILVAVINGPAIGIGVTTLALCDAIYASDKATFQTPFTALGQSAEGCSTYTFPKIMGMSKASELLYFNRKISAHEANEWGLVSKVFPDAHFKDEVFAWLKQLARLPVKSMIYTKALVRQWDLEDLRRANEAECKRLRERWVSEDCINAVINFLSKRSKL